MRQTVMHPYAVVAGAVLACATAALMSMQVTASPIALTSGSDQAILRSLQQQAVYGPALVETVPGATGEILRNRGATESFRLTVQNLGDTLVRIEPPGSATVSLSPGESYGETYILGTDQNLVWRAGSQGTDCRFAWVAR